MTARHKVMNDMKKRLLYIACLCLLSNMLLGQESIEVSLTENNPCSEKELTYLDANIKVCMVSSNNNEKATVSILMENNYQSERLIIFGQPWGKRELKRMGYLNKTGAEISAFEPCGDVVVVDPSDDGYIALRLKADYDNPTGYTIPVYIARGKKRGLFHKKRVVSDVIKMELMVTIKKAGTEP